MRNTYDKDQPMLDITCEGKEIVEIRVTLDGRAWVNVDNVCVLRICNAERVYVSPAEEAKS